jgi:hypothetical protein
VLTFLDPGSLLATFGAAGLFVVLVAETGLLGLVWTVGLVLAGHVLGAAVPGVDRYLMPVVAWVVLLSLVPLAVEALRARRSAGR